jgi:hypothetical protein
MVRIRQHGPTRGLFDISDFLADIDWHFDIDEWRVEIVCCVGEGAGDIESRTAFGRRFSDAQFRAMYRGIFQTIDGQFLLYSRGKRLARLEAVDSCYWEIESTAAFEQNMLGKYGAHRLPEGGLIAA